MRKGTKGKGEEKSLQWKPKWRHRRESANPKMPSKATTENVSNHRSYHWPAERPPLPLRLTYPSAFLHCNPQQSVQKRRVKEFAVIKQFCTDATLLGGLSCAHYGNFSAQVLHFVCANIRDTGSPTLLLCLPPFPTLRECKLKFYEWLQISWN